MLSASENELITRTGPGTPGGEMMRRYWQPAALSRELKADEPLAITVLGEDLVMFRDDAGRPQLISRHCPHRLADLSYGRVEAGGLRCIYHGWLMDGNGRCLERPAEGARGKAALQIGKGYPCHEAGGLILAWLGEGAPPNLPALPFLNAPEEQTFTMKVLQECNYLQGNEGNIDPAHLSFLHTFLSEGVAQNLNLRSGKLNDVIAEDQAPEIRVTETAFGLRISAARDYKPGTRWVRVTNFVMPNTCAIHGSPLTDPRNNPISENCGYQMNWHVPVDDAHHWKYVIAHRFDGPVDKDFMMSAYAEVDADYRIDRTRENRFRQNREEMRTRSYAGLGGSFFVHDKCVVETQGAIMDRSKEHLGTTDKALVNMRRQIVRAVADVQQGRDPLMVDRRPQDNSLADLAVLSVEVPDDADLDGDWWRAFFEDGRPRPEVMAGKPR